MCRIVAVQRACEIGPVEQEVVREGRLPAAEIVQLAQVQHAIQRPSTEIGSHPHVNGACFSGNATGVAAGQVIVEDPFWEERFKNTDRL